MSNTTAPRIIVSTSKITCRCCGVPLESRFREAEHRTSQATGQSYTVSAEDALTCKNPNCKLHNFTFDSRDYAVTDLSAYGVKVEVA